MTTAVRQSGMTAGQEQAVKQSDEADQPASVPDELETKTRFRHPNFSRMRTDWRGDDAVVVATVSGAIEKRIMANFKDAYQIMHDLFMIVREPEIDEVSGKVHKDIHGWPIWKRTSSGSWVEDFSKLGRTERDNFLFSITTRMFAWEQAAADAWGEAMLAKALWEEAYSVAFDEPMAGTISDRDAVAKKNVAEDRYFAVFVSAYSRKADAVVRSMTNLALRLRDSLGA